MIFRERGVKQFTESGTVLGMGTDSGTPMNFHTEALWREAKVHVDMGMPPIKVISALTRVGADHPRQDSATSAPSSPASSPTSSSSTAIRSTTSPRSPHVETVVKGGVVFKGAAPAPARGTATAARPE